MSDTIAAVATGNVLSAIGIIRMSGDEAVEIASCVFSPFGKTPVKEAENRKLYYGTLSGKDGEVIDMCLCTVSRGPGSYTGEDTVEFQCHGSPTVLREGLEALFAAGARQALAGEFTKRAFLNGRMDLTQAEAVIDLIESESAEAAKNAAGHLSGNVSRKTDAIYSSLTDILAHFHAVLDYPDEDIEEFELKEYIDTLDSAEKELTKLLGSYDRGKIMTEGVRSAVIGLPNVGKSSLLNALLGYERAIVTDIAGTTRDTIEEKVKAGSITLRLSDTAGIRYTDDTVEKLGVDRAIAAAEEARLVIAVVDSSVPLAGEGREILKRAENAEKAVIVLNKCDMPQAVREEELLTDIPICRVSAKNGEGIDELCKTIETLFSDGGAVAVGEIITNARQADAISRAVKAVCSALDAMRSGLTPDCVLIGVEDAMAALGELSGKTVREDITDRIFERFCVGK